MYIEFFNFNRILLGNKMSYAILPERFKISIKKFIKNGVFYQKELIFFHFQSNFPTFLKK